MYRIANILKRSVDGIRRRPWLHVLSVVTLAAAFTSFAATLTAAVNLDSLVAEWVGSAELTVYLRDGVEPADLDRLASAVSETGGVARVETVTPAQARERFAAGVGAYEELARGLPESAFPASLEVHLLENLSRDQRARHALAGRLRQVEMVGEVEVYDEWFERLSALSLVGKLAAWGLGLVALVVAMLVVAAAVRTGVGARRREIAVLRIVGATDRYVRLPFLLEGAFEAALAMGIALLALHAAVGRVEETVGEVLPLLGAQGIVRLGGPSLLALLGGGALAGMLGARLSLRRLEEV
jgi:cell division transport system permease protein